MNRKSKNITKTVAIVASALVLGVAGLFADQITTTIFNKYFQLGPADGAATGGDEVGSANILHSIDSNADYNAAPDWANIMVSTGSTSAGGDDRTPKTPRGVFNPNSGFGGEGAFVTDDASAGGDPDLSTYVGTGNKNSDPISTWTWSTNAIPNKDDISNGYVYTKKVTAPDGSIHKLLFAGLEREVASGDSHIDIEFFQAGIGLSQDPACPKSCTFTGSNTDGDILVNMDFTNGGAFGSLSVRKRHEGVTNNYDLVDTLNGAGCNPAKDICGFNNSLEVKTGGWASFDLHTSVIYSLPTNQFTEFGLDLTALGLGAPCLATVEFKSRSSQSFTAALKDFALHSFQACTATAYTEIHQGNTPGSPTVDYAVSGQNDIQTSTVPFNTPVHDQTVVTGQLGVVTPTGKVTFKQYNNGACTGTPAVTEDVLLVQVAAPTATTPGVAAADSSAVTPPAGTAVSWTAVFTPATGTPYTNQVAATPSCESLSAAQLASQVVTQIQQSGHDVTNTAITNGQPVVDVATVSVLPKNSTGTPAPTGTVTWNIYPNATCTGTTFTQQSSNTPTSSSSGLATYQLSYTPTSGTFVCFKAAYGGDTAYQPSASTFAEPICAFPNAGEEQLQ